MQLREVPHEVGGGELRRQVVVLGRVADAGADLDARHGRVAAEDGQVALVPQPEPEDEREERRLAGAVRAEQARDPRADLGVEARERNGAAVALDHTARGDDRGRCGLSGSVRHRTSGGRPASCEPTPTLRSADDGRPA